MLNEDTLVYCPHCKGRLTLELVSKVARASEMTVTIAPSDGETLEAQVLGTVINETAELLRELGHQYGATVTTFIKSIEPHQGGYRVTLAVARCAGMEEPKQ